MIETILVACATLYVARDLLPAKERVASFFKGKPKPLVQIREKGNGKCLLAVRNTPSDPWGFLDKNGYEWSSDTYENALYKDYAEAAASLEKRNKQIHDRKTVKVHTLVTT